MRLLIAVFAALTLPGTTGFADDILRPVKLHVLSAEQNVLEREFFGLVVARQTVDLAFQVAGQIERFPVVEGSVVRKGGLVAGLDLEPFELALEQAKLQHEQAERNLERRTTLGAGTVTQASIDDAKTAMAVAAIAIKNAEFALEHATLFAPFEALVASRKVANFATVAPGTPVARLHDMSEIRVEIDVPEMLFRRAQNRSALEIFAILPGEEARYPLEIREFNAETSAVGQTYTLTLGTGTAGDLRFLPGSSVSVIARQVSGDTRIFVPPSAIVIDPDGTTNVMQFEPPGADEGTVRKVAVDISVDERGRFVLKSGPPAGSEIAGAGASALQEGQKLRRFNGFGN